MTTRRLLALAALLLVAGTAWIVHAVGLNHDVAWFLEVARQIRAGATLDGSGPHDPKELNPPLALWLFVPLLPVASALGLPPTVVPVLLVGLEAGAALFVTWRLLRPLPPAVRDGCVLATALATVGVVGYDFAQREHQLVLLLTPALWSLTLCVLGRPAPRGPRVAAGMLAGIAVAFKPHFVVAWGLVELATALAARRPRLVWRAETLTAAVVLVAYTASVLLWAPGYLPIARAAAAQYVGWLAPTWASLLLQPEGLLAGAVLLVVAVRRGDTVVGRAALTFAAAGVAFAFATIAQRKGFSYHWYPPFAWSLLAALLGAASTARTTGRRLAPYALVIGLLIALGAGRLHEGVSRGALHRETARQIARAVGGSTTSRHDLYILSVAVEGPFPVASYLGLEWPAGMPAGFMSVAMPAVTPPAPIDPDQAIRDAVWNDLSADVPRAIVVSPMYTRGASPRPIPSHTFVDFFTAEPRFAAFFAHYRAVATVDRLGQPYYVVLRRVPDTPAVAAARGGPLAAAASR